MRTVLYARSSISTQEHSIDMQKALALEKITQKGELFDDMYLDEAVSARKTEMKERLELNRLMYDIKRGLISTVYVYKRDRLARNVIQAMELFELFQSHQINVVFTADNEIPVQYSPAGEFFELIIAGFNQREANQIVQRIKETKYTMTKEGKHSSGPIPYGYKVGKDKKFQVDPEQAEIIRKIFDMMIDTTCITLPDAIREMERQPWFPSELNQNRVRSMIGNKMYKGIRKIEEFGNFVEIANKNLVIVDERTWDKAQARLSSLKQTRSRQSNRVPMMLDGLLFCGKCNGAMFGKEINDVKANSYYTCKNHNYLRQRPDLLEETILMECAKFISQQFKTHFLEVYNLVHGDLIKFYEKSFRESISAMADFKLTLHNYTLSWLQHSNEELEQDLLYLYNQIEREELLQQHYPKKLAGLERQYQLMQTLHDSVDLATEVLQYDAEKRKSFIQDVISRIVLNSPTLRIQFREPFNGGLGHVNVK
ncbi:recombinase family protein [Paenibacillus protaetiae]|uniref:Recombinase family protein n=1 Tax=Paenibacillus protaetiae TaxID=2509456 RepID=A0A4P6EQD1_9BACL|nr:recombinase family protein [Paenibacillus protaetiae]QAY65032.1 recombinase family protein [Paenibacillus protaetiae]